MKQALVNMLAMQHRMNARVHENWVDQDFAWYRAAWIECGELIEHYGYKWWKKQQPEMEQVRLEVVDIWHFGLSALFSRGKTVEHIADDILVDLQGPKLRIGEVENNRIDLAEGDEITFVTEPCIGNREKLFMKKKEEKLFLLIPKSGSPKG